MLLVIVAACPLPAAERPNIVFLMADDQCTYSMGCYQTPDVKTPNLDQLAADGIVFDNHYATTAICMASRASVMTGLFEYRRVSPVPKDDRGFSSSAVDSTPDVLQRLIDATEADGD